MDNVILPKAIPKDLFLSNLLDLLLRARCEQRRRDCRDRIALLARLPSAGCQELGEPSPAPGAAGSKSALSQAGAALLQGCMPWDLQGEGKAKRKVWQS